MPVPVTTSSIPFNHGVHSTTYLPASPAVSHDTAELVSSGHLFSLDAVPEHLPQSVQVYLALVGCSEVTIPPGLSPSPYRPPAASVLSRASLCTSERMCHGLAILREQRRLGHGLFYDAFSASDLLKRPLYPFVPCGLLDDDISGTVDEVTRVWMVAPLGSSMVATNLILPVPPGWDRAPPSLYPAVISWLYSRCFPICTFMNEPRYESDEEGYFLFDKPVDIDQFTDDWILCESAHQLHDLVFRGRVRTLWRPHTVTCKADDQWALDSPDAPRGGAGARETDVFMLSLKADMRRVWWPAHPYDPPPTLQYINNSDSL